MKYRFVFKKTGYHSQTTYEKEYEISEVRTEAEQFLNEVEK